MAEGDPRRPFPRQPSDRDRQGHPRPRTRFSNDRVKPEFRGTRPSRVAKESVAEELILRHSQSGFHSPATHSSANPPAATSEAITAPNPWGLVESKNAQLTFCHRARTPRAQSQTACLSPCPLCLMPWTGSGAIYQGWQRFAVHRPGTFGLKRLRLPPDRQPCDDDDRAITTLHPIVAPLRDPATLRLP